MYIECGWLGQERGGKYYPLHSGETVLTYHLKICTCEGRILIYVLYKIKVVCSIFTKYNCRLNGLHTCVCVCCCPADVAYLLKRWRVDLVKCWVRNWVKPWLACQLKWRWWAQRQNMLFPWRSWLWGRCTASTTAAQQVSRHCSLLS